MESYVTLKKCVALLTKQSIHVALQQSLAYISYNVNYNLQMLLIQFISLWQFDNFCALCIALHFLSLSVLLLGIFTIALVSRT